jgi:hypothetical protein
MDLPADYAFHTYYLLELLLMGFYMLVGLHLTSFV